MKKFIFFVFALNSIVISAQNVFFETGMNFTNYVYSDSKGATNDNIDPGTGVYIRAGLGYLAYRSSFSYGISLNQFNATGGNNFDLYDWKVTHMGAFTQWYRYFNDDETFGFNLALELSTMLNGKQTLGEQSFNLFDYDEFTGVWVNPRFGLGYQVISTRTTFLEVGYSFQLGFNISGGGSEKLSFYTHQLGMKLNLN